MKKQELDFCSCLKYVVDQLNGGNSLSQELSNRLDFRKGTFYTLLPHPTDKNLYDFQSGGFLHQNPRKEYYSEKGRSTYSIIPTMHDEVADFIFQKLKCRKDLSCVFEELLDSPNSPQFKTLKNEGFAYAFKNEVYYLIKNRSSKIDVLLNFVEKSNAIWHSLCRTPAKSSTKPS